MAMNDGSGVGNIAPSESAQTYGGRLTVYLVALVVLGVTIACSVWWLRIHALHHTMTPKNELIGVATGVVGVVLAGLLAGIGALMRLLEIQTRQIALLRNVMGRSVAPQEARTAMASPVAALAGPGAPAEIEPPQYQMAAAPVVVTVTTPPKEDRYETRAGAPNADATLGPWLAELRDIMLMSDAQRQQRAAQIFQQRKQMLAAQIQQAVETTQWGAAATALAQMRACCPPNDADLAQQTEQLNSRYGAALGRDLEAAREQVRKYLSVRAWQPAQQVLDTLAYTYPQEPLVQELIKSVDREQQMARKEEFSQMFDELRAATDHRQWRSAFHVARQLIDRFPDERKVEKLRQELPILEENALVEERQEGEATFKDLLQRQRYEEAAAVAQRLMERFPDSSAAQELARLMPKIRELIDQERLKRQTAGV